MFEKNVFKVGAVGIDIRIVETSWFKEAVKAAGDTVGERVKVLVINSHKPVCDALLMKDSFQDRAPNGIPTKSVNIEGLPRNQAAPIIRDSICELHALVVLSRL